MINLPIDELDDTRFLFINKPFFLTYIPKSEVDKVRRNSLSSFFFVSIFSFVSTIAINANHN